MDIHRLFRMANGAIGRAFAFAPRLRCGVPVPRFTGGKDGLEAKVIALADRIVFVVVAIRARHGEAQHRLTKRGNLIGAPHIFQHLGKSVQRIGPLTQCPHGDGVLHGIALLWPEFVSGHLLHEKSVVGLVVV